MPTKMLPQSHSEVTPLSETTPPSCPPLDWRLIGASQGILLAPNNKPTPDEGIQYCIVKQIPTPWIHCPLDEIPAFTRILWRTYRSSRKLSKTLSLVSLSNPDNRETVDFYLGIGPLASIWKLLRNLMSIEKSLFGFPTTLHLPPSDSDCSTESPASTLRPVPLMRYVVKPVPIPEVDW